MIKREEIEFCEDSAISIEKFVSENFAMTAYRSKKNKKNRKWRVKHEELTGMPFIISVPIPFAHRYKELVDIGKLIAVRDDFGKYKVYINPRIIIESTKLKDLEDYLEELKASGYENTPEYEYTKRKIFSIQENIRIIKHFNGLDSLKNSLEIKSLLAENEKGTSRKRVVSNPKM